MKSFIIIVAASAALSASFVAGIAATDVSHGARQDASELKRAAAEATASAWVNPPAKTDAACREAAWPYRFVACGERKVRVISTDGQPQHGAPGLMRLPNGAAPIFVSLSPR